MLWEIEVGRDLGTQLLEVALIHRRLFVVCVASVAVVCRLVLATNRDHAGASPQMSPKNSIWVAIS